MIKRKLELVFTYDKDVDAAYIYTDQENKFGFGETYTSDDLPETVAGDINFDFDKEGHLLGIEILGASKILPKRLIDSLS